MKDQGNYFARLLVKHDRELRRYIMMLLPRHDDVEEVLQQTATTLWEKFDEYDQDRDFMPWATRFAYFEVLNFRKMHARNRMVYNEDVIKALAGTREELSEELKMRQSALQLCLSKLKAEDRTLINRRYADSSTIKSLAEESGRSVKSLYRRLDRIREAIVACVERQCGPISGQSHGI